MDGEQEAALRGGGFPAGAVAEVYRNAREVLSRCVTAQKPKRRNRCRHWSSSGTHGFPAVAHQLGKCWRDGLGVLPDDEQAELWFRRGAEAGHAFSRYALGRLLETRKRTEEAVVLVTRKRRLRANPAAAYRLGKLYLEGELVSQRM